MHGYLVVGYNSDDSGSGQKIIVAMERITLSQLETHLFHAADMLRAKMDASEYMELAYHLSERLRHDNN